jgi:hypothetical protein
VEWRNIALAINVNANAPQALLDAIYEAIDDGSIETWSYDEDGDFSHVTSDGQWEGQAWLHPEVATAALVLTVVPPKGGAISQEAYAVYHGRFIEMLLAHFDDNFSKAVATAQAANGDLIQS